MNSLSSPAHPLCLSMPFPVFILLLPRSPTFKISSLHIFPDLHGGMFLLLGQNSTAFIMLHGPLFMLPALFLQPYCSFIQQGFIGACYAPSMMGFIMNNTDTSVCRIYNLMGLGECISQSSTSRRYILRELLQGIGVYDCGKSDILRA